MEIDYKNILTGLLSKAYKLDNGKIEELFNAEGATADSISASLLETDAQRVSQLKGMNADNTDSFNQGYAKAKKDERVKFENEIKGEFGITSETIGLDLIKEIVSANSSSGAGPTEVTEDIVKKHSTFLQMERAFKKQLEDKEAEYSTKFTELETASKRNETFHGIRQQAIDYLATLKPVEPKNPTAASNIKNTFVSALKAYDYEVQADGSILVLKDGKRCDDAHGHAVNFNDIVKNLATGFYDFEESHGGTNAGNENKGGADKGSGAAKAFKNAEEAQAYANDSSIPLQDRINAMNEFTASQSSPEQN